MIIESKSEAGTVATCCNPSRGALLFRWIRSTGCSLERSRHQKSDRNRYLYIRPTNQPLYQGAGSRKNEARRDIRQVELQISLVECKVVGSIPERAFAFRLQSRDNDCIYNVPILMPVVLLSFVMWQLAIDGVL